MNRVVLTIALLLLPTAGVASLSLEVDVSDRELRVYDDGELLRTYPVSVGKHTNPTPTGDFAIRKIVWNPAWVPPNEKWARGKSAKPPGHPENPMKRVKMFFKEPDYYIHGTGDVDSLGGAESHGCVRMSPQDVTKLAQLVMERGGKPQPQPWYRRVLRRGSSTTVRLATPIPIRIR